MTKLTYEEANRKLRYDPEAGIIYWRSRPELSTWWNETYAGRPVGFRIKSGYRQLCIGNHSYFYHRVAWLLATGEWPKHTIDHINFDKVDNRLENLRDVPLKINTMHQRRRELAKGIYEMTSKSGQTYWVVSLKVGGKWTMKRFNDYDLAAQTRKMLEDELIATAYGAEPTNMLEQAYTELFPEKKTVRREPRPERAPGKYGRKTRKLSLTLEEIEALQSDPRSVNEMSRDPTIPVGRNVLKKIRAGKINPKWLHPKQPKKIRDVAFTETEAKND